MSDAPPRVRLGAMFFLEYAALGAVMPILSLFTKDHLGFSGTQAGLVQAMGSIAAIAAPLAGAVIADRIVPSRILLAVCHLIAAGAMVLLSQVEGFVPVLLLFLLHQAFYTPTIALTNAIGFHHLPRDAGRFARSRVWGTIGWVAIAWGMGGFWLLTVPEDSGSGHLNQALWVSAGASFVQAILALSLPAHGRPVERRRIWPAEAMATLRQRPVLILAVCYAAISATFAFHFLGMGPYLRQWGIAESWVMPLMSVAQICEIAAMAWLGRLVARKGKAWLMQLGLLIGCWQFTAVALDASWWLVLSSLPCHGLVFAWFSTTAITRLDDHCQPADRSGVHQLLGFLSPGCSALIGSGLAGLVMDWCTVDDVIHFPLFWAVPAAIYLIVALVLRRLPSPVPGGG